MALSVISLTSSIQRVFDKKLVDIYRIADELSQAYAIYAKQAQGPRLDPVILHGNEHFGFRSGLSALMHEQFQSNRASTAIADDISRFWLAPPAATASGGVCVMISPAAGIGKMRGVNVKSSAQAAHSLAVALDLLTKSVLVLYPTPPTVPLGLR